MSTMPRGTAFAATIRAARLSKRAAERGDLRRAQRAWVIACECAWKCGGLSGAATGGKLLNVEWRGQSRVIWAPRGI